MLGSEKNGIDGAHILTPMPYLISTGRVTQNNVPTPMYLLARLNLDAQAISVAQEYKDLKVTTDASRSRPLSRRRAAGKEVKVAMTFPAARTISGSAIGSPPAASTPTRTSPPSWCRRPKWWRT